MLQTVQSGWLRQTCFPFRRCLFGFDLLEVPKFVNIWLSRRRVLILYDANHYKEQNTANHMHYISVKNLKTVLLLAANCDFLLFLFLFFYFVHMTLPDIIKELVTESDFFSLEKKKKLLKKDQSHILNHAVYRKQKQSFKDQDYKTKMTRKEIGSNNHHWRFLFVMLFKHWEPAMACKHLTWSFLLSLSLIFHSLFKYASFLSLFSHPTRKEPTFSFHFKVFFSQNQRRNHVVNLLSDYNWESFFFFLYTNQAKLLACVQNNIASWRRL